MGKDSLRKIMIVVGFLILAGGIYGAIVFFDYLYAGDDATVESIVGDDSEVTRDLAGVRSRLTDGRGRADELGVAIDDSGESAERIQSRIDQLERRVQGLTERGRNLERALAEIEDIVQRTRGGLELGRGASEKLAELIRELQEEDNQGDSGATP
jgi:methyl-accepting chemotaxis protein